MRLTGGAPGWSWSWVRAIRLAGEPGVNSAGHEWALGASVPIDGFANGWRIGATCVSARMAFAPQSTANAIYVFSAVAIVVLILLALGVRLPQRLRRRRRIPPEPVKVPATIWPGTPTREPPVIRLTLRAALAWGIAVGAVSGFVFAWRFGVVAGPLTVVLLLAGISVRRLTNLSLIGVLAIVALYVFRPAHNYGGFSFYFSLHQILAHWIGAGVTRVRCAGRSGGPAGRRALAACAEPGCRRHGATRRAREGRERSASARITSRV